MNNLRLVALSAIALTLGSCRSSHPDSAPRGDAPRNPGVGTAKVGGASGSTAGGFFFFSLPS